MTTPTLSYMICSNPRSGSWLLTEGLGATGIAGNPREWLEEKAQTENCQRWGMQPPPDINYELYVNHFLEEGTSANGVFGIKCMGYQLEKLPEKLKTMEAYRDLTVPQALSKMMPNLHYLHLARRDKARQAVSYWRAIKTDAWWEIENYKGSRRPKNPAEPEYDPAAIARYEEVLKENEEAWLRYFKECGQQPLIFEYEELAEDYEKTIRHVLAALKIDGAQLVKFPPPRLKKQADEQVEDWVKRYKEYRRGTTARNDRDKAPKEAAPPTVQIPEHELQSLRKRESLVAAQRALAKLNPKTQMIERRAFLSRAEFLEQYYSANKPVILTGMMENWAARTRWTPDYLKATCGEEQVEIMAERNSDTRYEIDAEKHKRTVRFAKYIDMVGSSSETNDYYLVARNNFFARPAAKGLLADMEILPEYLRQGTGGDGLFLWYGPKGTVTPMHQDLLNIFMAQVKGRKRIKLIPASDLDCIYNHTGVYSQIDPENPDYTHFPKYRDATVMDFELAEGEVLFIPVGWWHHVRSLDESITVSFTNFLFPNKYDWIHPQGTAKAQASAYEPAAAKTPEPSLDKSWSDWITLNLGRECHPEGILKILLEKNFPVSAIRTAMGDKFPSQSLLLTSKHPALTKVTPDIDHQAVSQVRLTRLTRKENVECIDDPKIQLYLLKEFLSEQECDDIVKVINRSKLRPSTVTYGTANFRTSKTSDLSLLNDPVVARIDEKVSAMLGINLPYAEGTQAQKYEVGELFKAHTDYFEPGTEEFEKFGGERGNRTWTFMIYLNDTTKGGGTQFVNLGKTFYPRKGWALVWNNLYSDGRPNPDTMHYGMPVEEGEKIIITKWFRELGKGDMLRNENSTPKQLAFAEY